MRPARKVLLCVMPTTFAPLNVINGQEGGHMDCRVDSNSCVLFLFGILIHQMKKCRLVEICWCSSPLSAIDNDLVITV
jgi:hypothetical protein